jgi:hypothetical protein
LKRRALLIACLLLVPPVYAGEFVEIGFLELHQWDGRTRLLEPDFRYGHVALRVGERWVHAHPTHGVEWASDAELEKVGTLALKVFWRANQPLPLEKIGALLGRPYDAGYSWTDDKIYCSELVAKILGIAPQPMHFDPALWPAAYLKLEGQPGLSPGGLYRALASPVEKPTKPQ